MMAILQYQPVTIAVYVETLIFNYKSGVITDPTHECSAATSSAATNLNHGVTVVGYNTAATVPYFIVRNSWSASWGNKGYFWLAI